jgi:hypothetical protein
MQILTSRVGILRTQVSSFIIRDKLLLSTIDRYIFVDYSPDSLSFRPHVPLPSVFRCLSRYTLRVNPRLFRRSGAPSPMPAST